MSVNSKMTAIADKIRSLLGIAGKMGLDAMATNLGTEQTNVTNAFTAVGEKGGTVPASKVSGNLATAIASIPEGVTVQRKDGSLTTGGNGTATVNVGFQPDVVRLSVGHTWEDISFETAADFHTGNSDKIACSDFYDDDSIFVALYVVERTSTGFELEASYRDYDFEEAVLKNKTITYSAVKYT